MKEGVQGEWDIKVGRHPPHQTLFTFELISLCFSRYPKKNRPTPHHHRSLPDRSDNVIVRSLTQGHTSQVHCVTYALKRTRVSFGRTPQNVTRFFVPHTPAARGTGTPPTGRAPRSPVQLGTPLVEWHRPMTGTLRWSFAGLAWPPGGAPTGHLSGG